MESAQVDDAGAAAPRKKVLVLPGEEIALGTLQAGTGTYNEGGKVFASILGLKVEYRGLVSVVPLSGVYNPRQGDVVIGDVVDLGPSNWTIDIKTSQPAPLHVNDVPWKVDFGDTARYVAVGETVLCKVLKVDEVKRVFLTLAGPGLRKLEGGKVVEIAHTKVGRVVGKRGATLERLKQWTNCRIFPAANGRVWVDGEPADIAVATAAIELIEREADSPSLGALIDAFLREHGHEPKEPEPGATGFGTEDAKTREGPEAGADEEADALKREAAAKEEE